MLIIAILTDHCCHLIVKTKHHAIRKLLGTPLVSNRATTSQKQNYRSYDTQDSGLDDEEGDETPFIPKSSASNSDDEETSLKSASEHHEHIVRHMMYGDIGKVCYGKYGVGVVNFFIALTQFGFCVGYFIFIGNTVHSLFPYEKCPLPQTISPRHCKTVYNLSAELHSEVHRKSQHTRELLPTDTPFTILMSNKDGLEQLLGNDTPSGNMSTFSVPQNITTTTITPANITTTSSAPVTSNMSTVTSASNITVTPSQMFEFIETAPDLKILVACPVVIFVLFSFIRNVRYLGIISVLANISILGGCISVFLFLIIGKLL